MVILRAGPTTFAQGSPRTATDGFGRETMTGTGEARLHVAQRLSGFAADLC